MDVFLGFEAPILECESYCMVMCADEPPKNPRTIVGAKTSRIVRATGHKIELKWSPFHKGPGPKDVYDGLVRNIGAAVRTHVPMLASTYNALEEHHQDCVLAFLEV